MRIGFDANYIIYENAGIGRYSKELLSALLKNDRQNEFVIFANFVKHYDKRKQILEKIITASGHPHIKLKIIKLPAAWKDTLIYLGVPLRWLYREYLDIIHYPYFMGFPRFGFPKQIITIHDLAFIKFPNTVDRKLYNKWLKRTKLALNNSTNIVAVSKLVKKDIVKYFQTEARKISVVYNSASKTFKPSSSTVKQKYILSVATLEPRKNIITLVKAYHQLEDSTKSEYNLKLVGKIRWQANEIIDYIHQNNLSERVELTGFVGDNQLTTLYQNASLFVYPPLDEGFGIPPIEAMSSGCPVAVSDIPIFREIIGSAGLYFDPNNVSSLSLIIGKILAHTKLQQILIKRGISQSKKYDWDRSAKQLLKIYEEIY